MKGPSFDMLIHLPGPGVGGRGWGGIQRSHISLFFAFVVQLVNYNDFDFSNRP